jgi:CO/xanthine dehydrogenase Mo-binding subunit
VFAIESMMDMLAEKAGADPVEFRMRHLKDERMKYSSHRPSRWRTLPLDYCSRDCRDQKRVRKGPGWRYKLIVAEMGVAATT